MNELLNRMASFAARSTAFSKFVTLLEQVDGHRPNLLRALTYHRVDYPGARPALYPGLISATPEAFEPQMKHLADNYRILSILELLDIYRSGAELPPRAVVVTFDDAYCDFAEHAWPILKRYQIPVTLFVPTAFPDHPERMFWWDRLYQAVKSTTRRDELRTPLGQLPLATASQRDRTFGRLRDHVKRLPHREAMALVEQVGVELGAPEPVPSVLSWEALRQLAREGVTLGAHTQTHPLMNRISPEEARAEAVGSLRDLEREIGPLPPIFAYPGGGFSHEVACALEREGFTLAFMTERGIKDPRVPDRLQLRRMNIGRRTTLPVFRAQLLPWSASLNRWQPLASA